MNICFIWKNHQPIRSCRYFLPRRKLSEICRSNIESVVFCSALDDTVLMVETLHFSFEDPVMLLTIFQFGRNNAMYGKTRLLC